MPSEAGPNIEAEVEGIARKLRAGDDAGAVIELDRLARRGEVPYPFRALASAVADRLDPSPRAGMTPS